MFLDYVRTLRALTEFDRSWGQVLMLYCDYY